MKKFAIIVGTVFLILGIFCLLIWYNFIDFQNDHFIASFSPIKENQLFRATSRFIITFIYVVLGAGLYLHYKGNFYSSRILAFFYSVVIIDNLLSSLTILNAMIFPPEADPFLFEHIIFDQPSVIDFLFRFFMSLVYLSVAAICLNNIIPQLHAAAPTTPVNQKLIRLANCTIDTLILSQILFGKVPIPWINHISGNESILLYIVAVLHLFPYYAFFEILYSRTPGKFLTNSYVQTVNNTRPSVPTILLRTTLRFIPFEFLSFLFSANWHDRWSKTRVT
jgi:hypothetical protein